MKYWLLFNCLTGLIVMASYLFNPINVAPAVAAWLVGAGFSAWFYRKFA